MQAFALAKQFSKGKPSPKSLLYQSIFNPGKGLSKQKAGNGCSQDSNHQRGRQQPAPHSR